MLSEPFSLSMDAGAPRRSDDGSSVFDEELRVDHGSTSGLSGTQAKVPILHGSASAAASYHAALFRNAEAASDMPGSNQFTLAASLHFEQYLMAVRALGFAPTSVERKRKSDRQSSDCESGPSPTTLLRIAEDVVEVPRPATEEVSNGAIGPSPSELHAIFSQCCSSCFHSFPVEWGRERCFQIQSAWKPFVSWKS